MRAILTYHSIDPSGSPISVDPRAFRRHVEWLAGSAVRAVPLESLLAEPDEADAVALTFDDALESFAREAWPALRENGIPVTVFVPTDHAGRDNAWGGAKQPGVPSFAVLDWDALGRLAEEGVTLGSHTRSHPDLTALDDGRLADEIEGAARALESRTGRRPRSFAYPYGRHDERAVRAAGRVHELACTTELRPLKTGDAPLRLPRLDAYYYREGDRLSDWGRLGFRLHLGLRAAARRARAALAGR